ncbi:hypothetical protein Tco_1429667 [Tanacetum coccineum]
MILSNISKLVPNLDVDFMDLDSPEDDKPIIVEDEEEEEVHAEKDNAEKVQPEEPKETKDALASHPPSLRSIQIQELTNQVLLFQSQNYTLEPHKLKAEAEVALLSAQSSFLNVEKLTKLLVKSLSSELSKLLSSLDFSSSLPTELKELPSNLLSKVTEALDMFVQVVEHLKQQQSKPTAPETTIIIPPIITSTITQFESPCLSSPSKCSPQPERELTKKDKGKKAMSSKDAKEEGTKSKSDDANLTGSMVKSSKQKKLKQLDFITKKGEHIHLTADQIKEQKKLEELAKADMAKQEVKLGKEELVDLLGINVVRGFYKAKLQKDPITLKVCPNKKGVGWSTIYGKIKTRMDYFHKTKAELEIDFSKPLSEQHPLDKLNDLARKKRKNADNIHDYFRSTKKFKSSVQYEDHPARTVLNEPCLGMDNANIARKQLKPDKHGHGKGKRVQKPGI